MKKENLRKGLLILSIFLRIGCFTFGGGFSILALMEEEFVQERGWITKDELVDMTTVGRSVPGVMIANVSMIFGCRMAGVFGGICAVAGVVFPAVIILSVVTAFYEAFKANAWVAGAMRGIRAAVIPIIGCAALSLGKTAIRTKKAVCLCAGALFCVLVLKANNVTLVVLGVLAGLVFGGRQGA